MAADPGHKVEGTDTTAPTVSSVAITSDPGDDDTYGLGDSIEVTVTFSEDVTVTGTPQLELDFDGTARTADYSSTSGPAVVFSYTVALGESDADGIAIGADKLSLNGGEIRGEVGNDATLAHTALAADSGHKVDSVDAIAPTASSLSFTSDPGEDRTYGTGDVVQVTVTFSEDMTVTGTPPTGTEHVQFVGAAGRLQQQQQQRGRCGVRAHGGGGRPGQRRPGNPGQQADPERRRHPGRLGQRRYADAPELFRRLQSLRERHGRGLIPGYNRQQQTE